MDATQSLYSNSIENIGINPITVCPAVNIFDSKNDWKFLLIQFEVIIFDDKI